MVNVDISNIWCSVTLPMLLESEQQISASHAALMDGEAAAFLPWLDGDNSAVLEQVEEAARTIRALPRPDAKTVPILAMTANVFADDVAQCRQAGMTEAQAKALRK